MSEAEKLPKNQPTEVHVDGIPLFAGEISAVLEQAKPRKSTPQGDSAVPDAILPELRTRALRQIDKIINNFLMALRSFIRSLLTATEQPSAGSSLRNDECHQERQGQNSQNPRQAD